MLLQSILAILAASLPFASSLNEHTTPKIAQNFRLLSLEEGADPVWKTEEEKLNLIKQGVQFFDVTEVYEDEQKFSRTNLAPAATFASPSHQLTVKPILGTLSISNMEQSLSNLTAFNNRYYNSTTGAQASEWILTRVKDYAADRPDIAVSLFKHNWLQSSVIAKIPGTSASTPVTIIGSHLDSINMLSPLTGRAPGADDDGTGVVNLMEAFRALVAAEYKPSTPLEFHWYSGEEMGLLGSQDIAMHYKKTGVNVRAMIQFDMTGYFEPGTEELIALEVDDIDEALNTFMREIINSYSTLPAGDDEPCGYACSDHASWNKFRYPSAMAYEAITGNDNHWIHTSEDTTAQSGFSWSHSLEFAKVAVAAAYELTCDEQQATCDGYQDLGAVNLGMRIPLPSRFMQNSLYSMIIISLSISVLSLL
ncbi:aminopeptidase [Moniliophthora roreri MCA 2997]|uniref:Peptide hydrolase n=1 Tax=Moniliophthora roreri (strain MCA 2997) TaxID=1381753 RepID=V2XAK9_MONRO|nr:aminopeptidase [Moniliophthora roreri MCA 2997]